MSDIERCIKRREMSLNDRLEKATGWPCIVSRLVSGYVVFAWTEEDGGPMLEIIRNEDLLTEQEEVER